MAREIPPVVITFAGGVNSRVRPADVNIDECMVGVNFDLDSQQRSMRTRKPFDLVATAANASEIRGFAQLVKRDGSTSTLVQAGGTVYSWDGETAPTTVVGTVSTNSRLRGPRDHNFTLDEIVLITDIEKATTVKSWDGTTFQDLAHNIAGVQFFAKYCAVQRERAFFGNVTTDNAPVPHVLVGSKRGDATTLTVSDRPSSALGEDSPFFLVTLDLRPINGLDAAFGNFIISSQKGKLFVLRGSSAFDFEVLDFHQGSAVSGDEAMANIGNDVLLGLPTRIESLTGTLNFGDVETNDLSLPIAPDIENVTEWRIAYDPGSQQAYCFPEGRAEVWVLHKSLLARSRGAQLSQASTVTSTTALSPWSKWTTTQAMNFQPTAVMTLIDPVSGNDVVYAGDATGNIYRLNGDGDNDGGTAAIAVSRTSKLIRVDHTAELFSVDGWVDFRLQFAIDLTLTFIWGGEEHPSQPVTIPIGGQGFPVYNAADGATGVAYYGGEFFYSARFQTQIRRKRTWPAGRGNYLQVKAEFSGEAEIQEIGLIIKAAA